jgi:hypothetical protein
MRPRFRPTIEPLEAQTLPSGVLPAVAPVSPAPVTLTLTTDKAEYQSGQPVHMTLTETNTSGHQVTITDGPSVDGFYVTQKGATVWRSNAGAQPMFLRVVDLLPGQSYTLSATWDGHSNDPSGSDGPLLTGTFQVHSQVSFNGAEAPPVTVTIQPAPPAAAPALTVSVTTSRTSYLAGQPVTITLTETNRGKTDARVMTGAQILNGSVSSLAGRVWVYRDLREIATGIGVLHPGESRTFTLLWNGRPNQTGARVVPGFYAVRVGVDGLSAAALIQIRP